MSIFSDIENIEQKVVGWFKSVPKEAQDVLTATNNFLNVVKNLSTSATGETIITLAEAFFPAVTGLVSGAEAILADLTGLTAETPGQLLLTAAQKAASLTGASQVAAYTNIATAIASTANSAVKGNLTPQQIVSVIQLVHNPNTLGTTVTAAPAVSPSSPQQGATGISPQSGAIGGNNNAVVHEDDVRSGSVPIPVNTAYINPQGASEAPVSPNEPAV